MKVNNVSGALGAYQQSGTRRVIPSKETARTTKSDGVELSPEAQLVLSLKDKVTQAPEVRRERIEELRQQIANGTYRPNTRDVADRMIKARVFDELI
jgi:negative regulator of flagellin synthesis FlgM